MDEVKAEHSGNFKITGYGQAAPGGRYIATFVITEAHATGEVELKKSTGETFAREMDAAEAAIVAGRKWLEEHRPVNSWESKK
ncbi:hypothetical protein [Variovorax boronicumulans]|uniref:hypothetical protein n=1 Tax=Variovorax boronicumulans TaxID=436515 RepID=UPI000781B09C|nr:hypothetical protein [Variovorax boronicumulans]